jgi:hypothetical protein
VGVGLAFSAVQFLHVSEILLSARFWNAEEDPKFKKKRFTDQICAQRSSLGPISFSPHARSDVPETTNVPWFRSAIRTPTNVADADRRFPREGPDDDDLDLPKIDVSTNISRQL